MKNIFKKSKTKEQLLADLSNSKYDAFISYKHGDRDIAVAQKLQELLEHFPIASSDGKKIEKVFLDTGELSSSSDFVEQVEHALENSDWLIVICSPGSRNSIWVKQEVDTFLKYHDSSRILLLMTEGEPDEVFPLRMIEEGRDSLHILAADARADSKKEALKRLKQEALLKIAAPILGTSFDSLRQRNKTYRMQRLATFSVAALCVLAIFTAYIVRQSVRINEQYQQSRRNQARYMTTLSLDLLAEGEPEKALLANMELAPDNPADGPLVQEQMYIFNTLLGSYRVKNILNGYYAEKTIEVGYYKESYTSADGQYLYLFRSNLFMVYSAADGTCLHTITSDELSAYLKSEAPDLTKQDGSIQNLIPLGDDRVLLLLNDACVLYNVTTRNLESHFPANAYSKMAVNESLALVYSSFEDQFNVYRLEDGEQIGSYPYQLPEDDTYYYSISELALSADGKKLFIGISYSLKYGVELPDGMSSVDYFAENPRDGLLMYDLESGQITSLSKNQVLKLELIDDEYLAVIHEIPLSKDGYYSEFWISSDVYSNAIYRVSDGEQLIASETDMTNNLINTGIRKASLKLDGKETELAMIWLSKELYIYNLNDLSLMANIDFHSEIEGVAQAAFRDDVLSVGLASGQVYSVVMKAGDQNYTRYSALALKTRIYGMYVNRQAETLILPGKYKLIFCSFKDDENYQEIESAREDVENSDIFYEEIGGKPYRIVTLKSDSKTVGFALYEKGEGKAATSFITDKTIQCQAFGMVDDAICCVSVELSETDSGKQVFLIARNLESGEILSSKEISDAMSSASGYISSYISANEYAFAKDLSAFYCSVSGKGLMILPTGLGGTFTEPTSICPDLSVNNLVLTGDGQYLVFTSGSSVSANEYFFWKTDETKEPERISLAASESLSEEDSEDSKAQTFVLSRFMSGDFGPYVLLQMENKINYLVNPETGEVRQSEKLNDINYAAFFRDDRYLILYKDMDLYLYDIESDSIVSQYSLSKSGENLPTSSSGKLCTDSNDNYFCLDFAGAFWMNSEDDGMINSPNYVFYVSDDLEIYLQIKTLSCRFSGAMEEISNNNMIFAPLYSYEELFEKAKEIVGDRVFTEEERKEYFLGN